MDIIKEIEMIIPPLTSDSHKGQAGRIGIVGGSVFYTGAPYFAAISALKVGCDLAHVFCIKDASQVIKSYSPELIVHPILDSPNFVEEFTQILPTLHTLVIGPGLGREQSIFDTTRRLIRLAKDRGVPLVFDADGLFYLNDSPDDVISYKKAILTPNRMEFARLYSAITKKDISPDFDKETVAELSGLLGNVTIVSKGATDIISDGNTTVFCDEPGSNRRCGGQGDLLSGSMGVFSYWAHRAQEKNAINDKSVHSATVLAALGACMLTRRCNHFAFKKFQRSTITTDMIAEIHNSFSSLFFCKLNN